VLDEVAQALQVPWAAVCVAWVLSHPEVSSVLAGSESPEHNLAGTVLELPDEACASLNGATKRYRGPTKGEEGMSVVVRDKIIDAHIHVWTSDFDRYPLAPGFLKEDLWVPSFTPKDHFQYSGQGTDKPCPDDLLWSEPQLHLYLIAEDPETFVGAGIVPAVSNLGLADPDKTMVALSAGGIYAFRVRGGRAREEFGDVSRWLDYPGYEKMFAAGAQHNLALSCLMGIDHLPALNRMCTRYPQTPVILDHVCGIRMRDGIFPEEQLKKLCDMAQDKWVMVKIGPFQALVGNGNAPYLDLLPLVERVVDAFGAERCMWESDSGGPVAMNDSQTDYPAAFALIRDHAQFLSESEKEQILFRTAEQFFFKR